LQLSNNKQRYRRCEKEKGERGHGEEGNERLTVHTFGTTKESGESVSLSSLKDEKRENVPRSVEDDHAHPLDRRGKRESAKERREGKGDGRAHIFLHDFVELLGSERDDGFLERPSLDKERKKKRSREETR